MQAKSNVVNAGRHILLVGLVAQTHSYLFFTILIVNSHLRLLQDTSLNKSKYPWFIFGLIYLSSVFILVSVSSFVTVEAEIDE